MADHELPTIFRCVFAPAGAGARVVFGENAKGSLVHILDAERGAACNLVCPDCHGPLEAKKGEVRTPHFAHASRVECEHAGETALHLLAKEIIEERGQLQLPEAGIEGPRGYEIIRPAKIVDFTRVEVEPLEKGFRPDVIGIKEVHRNGESITGRLIIEIYVTHAVDEDKMLLLRRNKESAVEIDLSKLDRAIGRDELAELLLGGAPRKWLYHREIDLREAEIEAEAARRREHDIAEQERRKARRATIETKWMEARKAPPVGAASEDLIIAETELLRWRLIGLDPILFADGDDSYFDVEPIAWRTTLFSHLAPWHKESGRWEEQNDMPHLCHSFASEMRDNDWMKAPFQVPGLKKFDQESLQTLPWSPAADEARNLLRAAVDQIHNHLLRGRSGGFKVISSTARLAYADFRDLLHLIDRLTSSLRDFGVDLLLSGKIVRSKEEADKFLLRHDRQKEIVSSRKILKDAVDSLLQNSDSSKRFSDCREALNSKDFDIRIKGDRSHKARAQAWASVDEQQQEFREKRVASWAAQVRSEQSASAKAVATRFETKAKQRPDLREALNMEALGDFFTKPVIAQSHMKPKTEKELSEASRKVKEEEQRHESLCKSLFLLDDFCDRIKDEHLAQRIREYGCRTAVQAFQRGDESFLPGLETSHSTNAVIRGLSILSKKSTNGAYGDDFAARALFSPLRGLRLSLLDAILMNHADRYLRAFDEIESSRLSPTWVYPRH